MVTLETIEKKLHDAFFPKILEITDESHKHAGHSGWKAGQITHLHIKISSIEFIGKNQVTIHKMIYKALDYELKHGLHAVSITL
jgi:BolA family transcriptional regulator, general stress-responsive regulator